MSSQQQQQLVVVSACYAAAAEFLLVAASAAPPPPKRRRRHYLTRLTLQPLYRSAWRAVYESVDERGLLNTVGFTRHTFARLLAVFTPTWLCSRRVHRHCASTADVLGLCLQWLNSSTRQKTLSQVFAIPPASLCRLLRFGLQALLLTVQQMHMARIAWPTPAEMERYSDIITAYEPSVTGVFGFVDGVYFRCTDPPDFEAQNAYYNSWKSYCSITNVLVFAPDGCIIWARYNLPGSYHDARLARPLYNILLRPDLTPSHYCIVADTAFPRTGSMYGRILTPPKIGELEQWRQHYASTNLKPEAVVRVRQAAEWGMHTLQSVFARLSVPIAYDPPFNASLLLLIFHLFNLRARCDNTGQIRTVYCGPFKPS